MCVVAPQESDCHKDLSRAALFSESRLGEKLRRSGETSAGGLKGHNSLV